MSARPQISLGDRVKDKITGFTGIATAISDYIDGCQQVLINPPVKEDGSFVSGHWFDAERLAIVDKGAVTIDAAQTGGPANPSEIPPAR